MSKDLVAHLTAIYQEHDIELTDEQIERSAETLIEFFQLLLRWQEEDTRQDSNRENDCKEKN